MSMKDTVKKDAAKLESEAANLIDAKQVIVLKRWVWALIGLAIILLVVAALR